MRTLCNNLGGTYIDMMSGEFMINPLEPKAWSENSRFGNQEKETDDSPETFRKVTRLSQHISYLKDFFRAYKDFSRRRNRHDRNYADEAVRKIR